MGFGYLPYILRPNASPLRDVIVISNNQETNQLDCLTPRGGLITVANTFR